MTKLGKRLVLRLGYEVGFASANAVKTCWQVGYTEVARLCWLSVPVCVTTTRVQVGLGGVTRAERNCLLPVSLLKKAWRNSDAAARPIWMCKCKLMLIRIFHEAELGPQVSTTQILFPLNLLGSWQTQQQQRCYGRTLRALTFQLFACCVTRCILLGPGAFQDAGGKPR